jgi:hypothetical protein
MGKWGSEFEKDDIFEVNYHTKAQRTRRKIE